MLNTINMLMSKKGFGVIYIDNDSNVLASNQLADKILDEMDGVLIRAGKLSFYDKNTVKAFNRAFKSLTDKNFDQPIYVTRTSDNPPFKIDLFPFNDYWQSKKNKPSSIILISEPKLQSPFPEWIFKNYYKLTQAELATTKAVFENITLQEHAKKRGIKISTARWTLLNVFSKTYTNSQKELIALAMQYAN